MPTGLPRTVRRLRRRFGGDFDARVTFQSRAADGRWVPVAGLAGLRCSVEAEGATTEGVIADAQVAVSRYVVSLNPDDLAGAPAITSTHRAALTSDRASVPPFTAGVIGPEYGGPYELFRRVLVDRRAPGGT